MEREKDDDILSETNEESANITQDEETQPERTEDELKNIEVETKQWIDKVNNGKLREEIVDDENEGERHNLQHKEGETSQREGNKSLPRQQDEQEQQPQSLSSPPPLEQQQQQQQQQYNRSLKQPEESQEIAQHEKQQNVLPKPGQIVTQQAEHKHHHHHQQQQQQQHEKDKVEKELNILQKTPVRVPQPQQYPEHEQEEQRQQCTLQQQQQSDQQHESQHNKRDNKSEKLRKEQQEVGQIDYDQQQQQQQQQQQVKMEREEEDLFAGRDEKGMSVSVEDQNDVAFTDSEIPSNKHTNSTNPQVVGGKIFWKGRYVALEEIQDIIHDSQDDMSSNESGPEEDSRDVAEQEEILKQAIQKSQNDNYSEQSDSYSDVSDDLEMSGKRRQKVAERNETFKLLAEKEFYEIKYHRLFHEKEDLQKKMKILQVEKESLANKHHFVNQPKDEFMERATQHIVEEGNLESENKSSVQENKTVLPEQDLIDAQFSPKNTSLPVRRVSIKSPEFTDGFADDIAVLAKENKKLEEILDHLKLNSTEDIQENDPIVEEMLDSIDKYVSKGDFLLLEQEKLNFESLLREKDKILKEKERELEDARNDFDDKTKMLKKHLQKAEDRNKDKSQLLNEYELNIFDLKRTFSEKLEASENLFENERLQKMKAEKELVELKTSVEEYESKLNKAKQRIDKLETEGNHLNENFAKEATKLKKKLEEENAGKLELGTRIQNLLRDMMQQKDELFQESKKHSEEQKHTRDHFDEERMKLIDKHHEEIQLLITKLVNPKEKSSLSVHLTEVVKDTHDGDDTQSENYSDEIMTDRSQEERRNSANSESVAISISLEKEETVSDESIDCPRPETNVISGLEEKINSYKKENEMLQDRVKELEYDVTKRQDIEQKYHELQQVLKQEQNVQHKYDNFSERGDVTHESKEKLSEKPDLHAKEMGEEDTFYYKKWESIATISGIGTMNIIKENAETVEHEFANGKDLENKICSLKEEIRQLKNENSEFEKIMVESKEELEAEYQNKLERERETLLVAQKEINNNASALKRVTEDWEQMLKNAVGKYEKELKRSEEEKEKMREEIEILKAKSLLSFEQQTESGEKQLKEVRGGSKVMSNQNYFHNKQGDENNFQQAKEKGGRDSDCQNESEIEFVRRHFESEQKRLQNEHQKQLDNEKNHFNRLVLEKQERMKDLAYQNNYLKEFIKDMEQKKDQERNDLVISFAKEKQTILEGAEEHFRIQLNQDKAEYERSIQGLRLQMEIERKKLQEVIYKNREVLQEKIENEFLRKILTKTNGITGSEENGVIGRTTREKIHQLQKQIEDERNNYTKVILSLKEKFVDEQTKNEVKTKSQIKVMEMTIESLTKEVEKIKQDKKEFSKSYKKDKMQVEEAYENEINELKKNWQKVKNDIVTKLQEESSENLRREKQRCEEEVHKTKCELRAAELHLVKMEAKFNEEKYQMEKLLDEMKWEIHSLRKTNANIVTSTEKHYAEKLENEKRNVESTFYGLRKEIVRLQGYIGQLREQLVNKAAHFNEHTNSLKNLAVANSEVAVRLENEYRLELAKEKERYECKAHELQCELDNLRTEMSFMKGKVRQEKAKMLADIEREKEIMEERFVREREDWRVLIKMMRFNPCGSEHKGVSMCFCYNVKML